MTPYHSNCYCIMWCVFLFYYCYRYSRPTSACSTSVKPKLMKWLIFSSIAHNFPARSTQRGWVSILMLELHSLKVLVWSSDDPYGRVIWGWASKDGLHSHTLTNQRANPCRLVSSSLIASYIAYFSVSDVTITKQLLHSYDLVIILQSVYRGDYATYERSQSALAVMANDPGNMHFIPTFADFHLQMRWSKVNNTLLLQYPVNFPPVLSGCAHSKRYICTSLGETTLCFFWLKSESVFGVQMC